MKNDVVSKACGTIRPRRIPVTHLLRLPCPTQHVVDLIEMDKEVYIIIHLVASFGMRLYTVLSELTKKLPCSRFFVVSRWCSRSFSSS